MLGHRRSPTLFQPAATAVAMTIAFAACTSGSDALPVPGADDVITAPVASIDDAPVATDTALSEETPTSAAPEPVATEPAPDTAPTTLPPTTLPTTTTTAPVTVPKTVPTTVPTTSTVPVADAPDGNVVLRLGDEGDDVGVMQFKLSVLEYLPSGSDDGVFGEATESGLRRFQSDYGLGVDGVFGPITERSLDAALQSIDVES